MSVAAYQNAATRTEDPRATEYRLFGQVTRALIEARDSDRLDFRTRADALDRNRRLWVAFATDCSQADNGLPEQLRAAIISLSIFIDRETSAVMRGQGDIDGLIEINRTVMQGLAPGAGESAQSA